MGDSCTHDELRQLSTITAETVWNREPDGHHLPEATFTKVLWEETEWFECSACGERVSPDLAP